MIKMNLLTLYFSLMCSPYQKETSHELTVEVKNIKAIKGSLRYAIYTEDESFLKEAFTFGGTEILDSTVEFKVSGLEEGTYAVSVFHDENNNGELDANFIGIPTEPYAFSNNAKGRFGPPSFEDCQFTIGKSTKIEIEL